jgi:hypothetical protein
MAKRLRLPLPYVSKILMVDDEDVRKRMTVGEANERGVPKVHGAILVAGHKSCSAGRVGNRHGGGNDGW